MLRRAFPQLVRAARPRLTVPILTVRQHSGSLLRWNGAGNADLLSVHEIPSTQEARQMPRFASDISGEGLYILAYGHKDVEAIREALRREAMAVDGITYEETSQVVHQLNDANSDWLWLQRLPYHVSICAPGSIEPVPPSYSPRAYPTSPAWWQTQP